MLDVGKANSELPNLHDCARRIRHRPSITPFPAAAFVSDIPDARSTKACNGQMSNLPDLTTRSQPNRGEVEVLLSDDGCGMNSDVRRQAFNPLFTTRRDLGCTGLGLRIVQ